MAINLSISRAWDETRAVIAHDGKLITSVALALMVLPAAVVGLIAPPVILSGVQPPGWASPLGLLVALIGVAGQVAVTRLALGPATTVGDAIGHGFRRLWVAVLGAFLFAIAMFLICIPLFILLAGEPGLKSLAGAKPAAEAVRAAFVVGIVALLIGVRFQLIVPVATAEPGGPIHALKRTWALTKGHYFRMLAVMILYLLVLLVVVLYVGQIGAGLLVKTTFGDIAPLSVAALIAALIAAAIQAAFSSVLAVMLARIYGQLAGGGAEASVPSSGT